MLWPEEQPRREQPVCGIHDGRDYRPGLKALLCNTAHFCVSQVTEIIGRMAKIESGPNKLRIKTRGFRLPVEQMNRR
jgi:hypothetical protein